MSHQHEHHAVHQYGCQNCLPDISDYIDGELSPELCAELERHIKDCERCRIVINTTRKTIELYRSCSEQEKTPAEVRERLYKRLNLEDFFVWSHHESKKE